MSRKSGRGHIQADSVLGRLSEGREGAVDVMRQAKIGSAEYRSAGFVLDAIDDLALKLTGDRTHFHSRPASTAPRED